MAKRTVTAAGRWELKKTGQTIDQGNNRKNLRGKKVKGGKGEQNRAEWIDVVGKIEKTQAETRGRPFQ